MAHKELKYDSAARSALEAGVDAVANAVKVTLGPRGRYVVLDKKFGAPTITDGDEEIGDVIADAIEKVGKDGVVNVEEGQTFGMDLEFTEGMQFDKGYISPYMVTDQERMEAVLEDPYILIANQNKTEIENTDSDFDREKLQERLAKLSGGVAVVKVGAATETEMKEKKHRVEDALQATRAALEEGIVPGGGVASGG